MAKLVDRVLRHVEANRGAIIADVASCVRIPSIAVGHAHPRVVSEALGSEAAVGFEQGYGIRPPFLHDGGDEGQPALAAPSML